MSEFSPTRNRLAGDGETPTAMGGGMDDEIVRLQHQLRLEGPPLERRALDARDPQPAFSAYSYEPTLRDRFASYLIGDRASSPEGRRLAEGLFGSIGMGHSSVGLLDVMPGGPGYWLDAATSAARGNFAAAGADAASAARVGVPYAIAGKALRRGQELGSYALTMPEWLTLFGLGSTAVVPANERNPLAGPPPAYGADRNALGNER